jgi:TRAP-type C4-dicarboxylate transport system substrate-binding protein
MNRVNLALLAGAAIATISFAARADEPIVLKMASVAGAQSPNYARFNGPWIERINKESEGAIEIKPFFGGVLANFVNMYDRLVAGVFEIGGGLQGMIGGQFPGTSVADLPIVSEKSRDSAAALWALYEQGLLAEEYSKVKPLLLFVYPQISLHFRKPIKTPDQLKGLKMSVSDKTASETMSKLGVAPVTMGPEEIYSAVGRGVIDGAAIQWTGILPFKLQEVTNYHVKTRLGSSSGYMFMNKEAYAKLPAKGKRAIDNNTGYKWSRENGAVLDAIADDAYNLVSKQPGHTMATFSAGDEARMYKQVEPVLAEWMKRTPIGEKILAAFKAEVAKSAAMR